MSKIILALTLAASVLTVAATSQAAPRLEPLDGYKFFESIPTGQ